MLLTTRQVLYRDNLNEPRTAESLIIHALKLDPDNHWLKVSFAPSANALSYTCSGKRRGLPMRARYLREEEREERGRERIRTLYLSATGRSKGTDGRRRSIIN